MPRSASHSRLLLGELVVLREDLLLERDGLGVRVRMVVVVVVRGRVDGRVGVSCVARRRVIVAPSSPQPQVAHMVSSLPSRGSAGPGRPALRHRHFRRGTTGSGRSARSRRRRCGSAPRPARMSMSRRAPSATVPSVASSKQNCIAVGDHGAQRADLELDAVHAATGGVLAHRIDDTLRDRHFVHHVSALRSANPNPRTDAGHAQHPSDAWHGPNLPNSLRGSRSGKAQLREYADPAAGALPRCRGRTP